MKLKQNKTSYNYRSPVKSSEKQNIASSIDSSVSPQKKKGTWELEAN